MDFGLIGIVLAGVSLILHAVAKRTKTKVDDHIADAVDFAKDKALPIVAPLFPNDPAKPSAPTSVTGFKADGGVRDHRK